MSAGHSTENADLLEYTRLLIQLHDLIGEGRGDTDEADALREDMYDVWVKLSPEEAARVNGLSADLYMLSGEEIFENVAAEERAKAVLGPAIQQAWHLKQWDKLLSLLRKGPDFIPSDQIAVIRSLCYEHIGLYWPALRFVEFAAQLAPENSSYLGKTLMLLHELGRSTEIIDKVRGLVASQASQLNTLVLAALLLLRASQNEAPERANKLKLSALEFIQRALALEITKEQATAGGVPIASAYVILGLLSSDLGRANEALDAYSEALRLKPDDVWALTFRGLQEFGTNRKAAIDDFWRAVSARTTLVYPYFYLAYHALSTRSYSECITLCRNALQLAPQADLVAVLLEWIAIASAEMGEPSEMIERYFQEAIMRDPINERIRRNRDLFLMSIGQATSRSNGFEIDYDLAPEEASAQLRGTLPDTLVVS